MAGQGPAKRRHVAVATPQQEDNNNRSTNGDSDSRGTTTTAYAGPVVSDGARLSYADLNQASIPPQAPSSNSVPLAPVVYTAIINPTPEQARLVLSPGCEGEDVSPIFLMRQQPHGNNDTSSSTATATATIERAYAILPHKQPIPLKHGDPNYTREWGRLYYGIAYPRDHHPQQQQQQQLNHDANAASDDDVRTFRVPNLDDDDEAVLSSATPDDPIFVAIKMINKEAVAHALGGNAAVLQENTYGENPYKEIARMQEMGDNQHVIKCLDALQDEDYLYIITPWALGGDLKDFIWNNPSMVGHFDATSTLFTPARNPPTAAAAAAAAPSPYTIGTYFCQILDIVAYMERSNIHHRDLSPDNFLFLDKKRTILVAMDLAMSVRIPTITVEVSNTINTTSKTSNQSQEEEEPLQPQPQQRQQRTLIAPIGRFGTVGWMAPEIYWNFAFDGVGCDLWSAMLILYNLLTRQILYRYPHPADISFRYFVHAGGLTYNSINERTIQIQMEVFNDDNGNAAAADSMEDAATFAQRKLNQKTLLTKAQAHVEFSRDIRELFHHFFRAPPTERWTLAQVMESSYVQQHRQQQQQPQENPHHYARHG